MKLIWLGYLVYSLSNCAIKLCIEIGLITIANLQLIGGWFGQTSKIVIT